MTRGSDLKSSLLLVSPISGFLPAVAGHGEDYEADQADPNQAEGFKDPGSAYVLTHRSC
jgi:hypothetical protein